MYPIATFFLSDFPNSYYMMNLAAMQESWKNCQVRREGARLFCACCLSEAEAPSKKSGSDFFDKQTGGQPERAARRRDCMRDGGRGGRAALSGSGASGRSRPPRPGRRRRAGRSRRAAGNRPSSGRSFRPAFRASSGRRALPPWPAPFPGRPGRWDPSISRWRWRRSRPCRPRRPSASRRSDPSARCWSRPAGVFPPASGCPSGRPSRRRPSG